jgi:hypothetical protein
LLSVLERHWPARTPRRDVAGLPPAVLQAVHAGPLRTRVAAAAHQLDRAIPGWPERAAAAIHAASRHGLSPALRKVCALLAHRPLRQPEVLLRAIESTVDPEALLWLFCALAGSDTPSVRSFWLRDLRARAQQEAAGRPALLWFSFLRAFLGGWLSYADFRDCLTARALSASNADGDYRRSLSRLGLDADPGFAKWYRQVIYEIAHQPDVSLSFQTSGWVQDFPGEDYLWDAMGQLAAKPNQWWPLFVLRWGSGTDTSDARILSRLADLPLVVLCLVSLLRPDLCAAVSHAIGEENHEAAIEWLQATSGRLPLDLRLVESRIRPWAERIGQPMSIAAGALCSVDPPADYDGPKEPVLRRREFVRSHLLPQLDRVMDNLLYVCALRQEHFDVICRQALEGRPAAIRALALWPEKASEGAPALFRVCREGSSLSRQAAYESLEILRARAKVGSLADYEKRLDLASAWADAGLDGRPGRVWWDVKGYRLKLSVAAGRVSLNAFSGRQRLNTVPRVVREDPQYEEIREARSHLAKMYRYFRRRFEVAMVERACYGSEQLAALLANPVVRSLVSRLVLLADGEPFLWTAVDPLSEAPSVGELPDAEEIRVAHPLDLAESGALSRWQERVIQSHIAQPFKQVFRECYLLGEREQEEECCRRFAGHPLVARQAFALLRSRGYSPRQGDAEKRRPESGVSAHIQWAEDEKRAGRLLAAAETRESVTSGAVWFAGEGGTPLRLAAVSPVVVSETLRDADLLVSRAAAGELGYTSEHTLQLRASLIRYLARALGLTTIYVSEDSRHALVEGSRAMYRVHLASGSAFLEESRRHLDTGSLNSNKPFRDLVAESVDTVTARVVGLIGALANDHQITDPDFLSQL